MGSGFKLIPNYIYFYHLDEFCILPFYPESITDSQSAQWNGATALGRTAPVQTYSGSSARDINFTFDLHRSMMDDYNKDVSNLRPDKLVDFKDQDYVDMLVKHLQAIALPKYAAMGSIYKGIVPPMIAVRFGNDIFIKGVVNNVSLTYSAPILDNGKYAKVSLSLSITEVDPYDANSVLELGSFRGLAAGGANDIYAR